MTTGTYRKFGRAVSDTFDPLRVRILPQDIKGAVCRDHQKCVIARALMRKTGAAWVDVGACTVLIGTSEKRAKRYRLNSVVKDQIRYFDTHKGVFAPCVVTLNPGVHEPLQRRKGKRARSGPSGRSNPRAKPTR